MSTGIEGFSCLGSFGSGGRNLADAIRAGRAQAFSEQADVAPLADFFPPRSLRQCDHFSRLALLGACRAAQDAGSDPKGLGNCGIVLATGYGPATPTFDFLDSFLDYGEQMASPLAFSLSVHNIPAAIVAKTLGISGPCATVCQNDSAVASGLTLARQWLEDGRVERVLFGAVDEYTELLKAITERLARLRHDAGLAGRRRLRPLGEASAFFLLSKNADRAKCGIASVMLESRPKGGQDDLPFAGESPSENSLNFLSGAYPAAALNQLKAWDGSAAYGNIPVAQALDCAAAVALLLDEHSPFDRASCRNCTAGVRSEIILER